MADSRTIPDPVSATDIKHALAPSLGSRPRVLILGSIPGDASLRLRQYYGHPRNAFWSILATLTGRAADAPYAERVAALHARGFALWDVIARCARPGSLDSAIDRRSIEVNDIAGLLRQHPSLELIALNGGTAAREFERRVRPQLDTRRHDIETIRLPSTSPACARLSLADKIAAWSILAHR